MKKYLTYYELLGVETNATTEEILKAYKEKFKEYHPDKNGGTKVANDMSVYLNQAKEWLTDPIKRLEYDYLVGVKVKPEKKVKQQVKKSSSNNSGLGLAIGMGLLGLVVGVAVGKSNK